MTKAYEIRIYGRVFNVGFRRYVYRYATANNIVGYVENDWTDESVHIIAEGEEKDLDHFSILCGEGTPYSLVTNMKIEVREISGKYKEFKQIR